MLSFLGSFFSTISESSKLGFAYFIFVVGYVLCSLEMFKYENPRKDTKLLYQILAEVKKIQNKSKNTYE